MKIAVCNELFQGWPIEEVFQYVARLGYDGVEIAPFTFADSVQKVPRERQKAIRCHAEKNGVEIVGLHWLLAQTEGLSINHPDETIRNRTLEYLQTLIHFCSNLGGKVLVHGSSRQRNIQKGWDINKAWKHAREIFEVCAEVSRKKNVTYCIEPLKRPDTNFINTVEEALQLVREIDHPHFKMIVDSRSAFAEEKSVPEALLKALKSGHLRHVHVNDPDGRGPGFGETHFTPILKTLIENGYRDYISVEVFQSDPDPKTIAGRSIGYLKGIQEALDDPG